MRGNQTNEFDVQFPASDVWNVFGTLTLPKLIRDKTKLVEDIQITGDGSVGTIFENFLLPGAPFSSFREKIVTLDQKHHIKEVQLFEGGFLTLGFISFKTRSEIIVKAPNLTTIRSSYIYEIKDEDSANEATVTISNWGTINKAVIAYLSENSGVSSAKKD